MFWSNFTMCLARAVVGKHLHVSFNNTKELLYIIQYADDREVAISLRWKSVYEELLKKSP